MHFLKKIASIKEKADFSKKLRNFIKKSFLIIIYLAVVAGIFYLAILVSVFLMITFLFLATISFLMIFFKKKKKYYKINIFSK
jgi:hypothetical protein